MTKTYTKAEKFALDLESNMIEVNDWDLEDFAESLERNKVMWYAIELGRCPSTDKRTYILHTWFNKPEHDYHGATKVKYK